MAFLITTDVDDFGEVDLVTEKIAAVNPDLYMASRFTDAAYQRALTQLVTSLTHPPKTLAQMHALIGRKHPRLHARFAHLYPRTTPHATNEPEPHALYRGARCIICGRTVTDTRRLAIGCHPTCRAKVTAPPP